LLFRLVIYSRCLSNCFHITKQTRETYEAALRCSRTILPACGSYIDLYFYAYMETTIYIWPKQDTRLHERVMYIAIDNEYYDDIRLSVPHPTANAIVNSIMQTFRQTATRL
jgi:hypothetical protein